MWILSRFRAIVHAVAEYVSRATRPPQPPAPPRPMQPIPLRTRVASLAIGGKFATAIFRQWVPGDTSACRLCQRCTASHDSCLLVVAQDKPLPRGQGPMFCDAGLVMAPPVPKPPKKQPLDLD
jgi:hypothetical protein